MVGLGFMNFLWVHHYIISTMQVSAWQFPIIRGCTNHYQSDAGSRMKYLLISIVVVLWLQAVHSSSFSGNEEKTPLYFSYITTITGDLTIAGAIPVVDLALEQINNRTDILPNYTFNYTTIRDSKVYPYTLCHYTLKFTT